MLILITVVKKSTVEYLTMLNYMTGWLGIRIKCQSGATCLPRRLLFQ
jgi:hypothetical protein